MNRNIAIILLAGGHGSRFGGATPKQFQLLNEKPLVLHSFEIFQSLPQVKEIIVVSAPNYRFLFPEDTLFALPGKRRQDSVYNGLQALKCDPELVCIHDAARPFITKEIIQNAINEANIHGAAAVGVPIKFTIKEHSKNHFVASTPDRSKLWEIQTPQVIKTSLLYEGFEKANKEGLTVTDDVSLVELLGKPVKLVEGSYTNLKITTPDDMVIAKHLIHNV